MASRSLGTLTLDLVAKTGGFEQGMDRAARKADSTARKMERAGKQIGKAIGIAFTAAVAVAGTATIAIKGAIDSMDDLSKAAQRASLPTEDFTRLAYAGDLADVSMEELTKSLGKLAKAQGDAQLGLKTQTDAFKQLGIEFKNADGTLRNTKDVFEDFAEVFQKYQGTPEVVAAGMQIFGRSFQTLIPLLKGGKEGLRDAADEADRLGITLSTKAGQDAEEFNDNLTRLKTVVDGLWRSIAADLLPDLIDLSREFINSATEGDGLKKTAHGIAEGIREIIRAAKDFGQLFAALDEFGGKIATLQNKMAALGRAANALFRLNLNDFKAASDEYNNASDKIAQGAKKISDIGTVNIPGLNFNIPGTEQAFSAVGLRSPYAAQAPAQPRLAPPVDEPKGGKGSKGSGKSDAQRAAEEAIKAQEEARKALEDQIKAVTDARESFEAYSAQLAGPVADANYQFAQDQQRLIDLAKAGEISTHDLAVAQANLTNAHREELEAIEAQLHPAREMIKALEDEISLIGLSRVEQEKMIALRHAGADATEEEVAALVNLIEIRDRAYESQQIIDDLKDSSKSFLVDLTDGVGTAREAWDDFFDTIKRRALEFVADKAINALFDALSGGGGGTGSSASGNTGFWSSLIGGLFGGGRATGGPVSSNQVYEVGESDRPELLMSRGKQYLIPGNNGTIVPAGGGAGAFNQNNYFTVPLRTDSRTEQQYAQRAGNAASEAIRRNRGR